ncbi:hypothetical protein BIV25_26085 [Streptomyces sp. MUSC 14]|uniref:hypothetical protein n=1 Tax=Streptomyces sp. MUSC 14 TaxID=1354889 RepID=UPI0008F5E7ED|nr:hypothetical protein [Streptomyces sp. MUSC 14]OIJ93038.1 hypothetical protein BIV25_26085 [Streptomyces sp. MUSC 14]
MAQIDVPDEGQLPPGPHRDLVLELHALHESAGWPGSRLVSRKIKENNYDGSMSHERFRSLLLGRGFPRWINVEPVVRVLALWSSRDPDSEADRIQPLWAAAERQRTGRAPAAPPVASAPQPVISQAATGTADAPSCALPEHSAAARLLAQATRLAGLGRSGEARIALSSAATWQLDDLCELTDWLERHDAAADAETVLRTAGGGRPVAEIAMLVERLTESGRHSHAAAVLAAAGSRRPAAELNALIERMRRCGRRPEVRQALIGAGARRPMLLLREIFAFLEEAERGDESRLLLNAVAQHRTTAELLDLLDHFADTRRVSHTYWLLDVIARERPATGVVSLVDHLVPAKRDREAAAVLETVGRHRAVPDLFEIVGLLRRHRRDVSARHVLEAAGTHRSFPDLAHLVTVLIKEAREPDLVHILAGAQGERAGARIHKAIGQLRAQGVNTDELFTHAGLEPDDLARVRHTPEDNRRRLDPESLRSQGVVQAGRGVLLSWELGGQTE